MDDDSGQKAHREALKAATKQYKDTLDAHRAAAAAAAATVVAALAAGLEPAEVTRLGPFSASYVRRHARAADLPPARTGPKPGTPRPAKGTSAP